MFIIMFCSSQWCFLSFCLTFFLYFFLSFFICSSWVTGPEGHVRDVCMHSSVFLTGGGGGVLPHHTQTSAACCVIKQIQHIRDRAAPPPLSSRTSSYHILRSTTCWVHRAISIPHDPLVSLCVSAGDLGYVKHPHTAETKFATCNISLRN